MDLANWDLRTSLKFTTGVKYQLYHGFDLIRDLEIPITLRPQLDTDNGNELSEESARENKEIESETKQ